MAATKILNKMIPMPATAKTTPVDADAFNLWDSEASWARKYLTLANLKTAVQAGLMAAPASPEQGDVLYYSGSAWARLEHGTAGQVLQSGGHAANPSWLAARAPLAAVRHVFWPAGAAIPRTTAGAATGTVETGTNDVMYDVFDFDSATDEAVAWVGYLEHWGESTIKVKPVWTAASGTGTVCWSAKARAYDDGDALDQDGGTPQTSTDTYNETAGDLHIGPATAAITVAGKVASWQPIILQVMRDVSEDTLNADARLLGVWIEYTEAATEEAAW